MSAPNLESGNCRKVADPNVMHPHTEDDRANQTAKRVCIGCPVQAECLTWAIENREQYGVWGGLSEKERKPLIRRRTASAATAAA